MSGALEDDYRTASSTKLPACAISMYRFRLLLVDSNVTVERRRLSVEIMPELEDDYRTAYSTVLPACATSVDRFELLLVDGHVRVARAASRGGFLLKPCLNLNEEACTQL